MIKAHECVFGRTQSGKTYYSIKRLEDHQGPVLFWNPQRVKTKFTKANGKYHIEQLLNFLSTGGKVDYVPIFKKSVAKEELDYIIQSIYKAVLDGRIKDLLVCVDEAHIYGENSNNPMEDLATGGLGLGLYGLFITQRPAKISNTLFTQSEIKTYFEIEEEEYPYFKRQGVDIEHIQNSIKSKGKYHYMQKINGEYKGPMKK